MKSLAALMMICSFAIIAMAAPTQGHSAQWKCEVEGISKHSHQENLFDGFGLSETDAQKNGMAQCRAPIFSKCHVLSCARVSHQ